MISRRRAIAAIAAFLAGPSGTVWLAVHHKPLSALLLGGLFVLYCVAELVAFEVRDHAAAAAHLRYEREAAGPILGDYTPQTLDHYYTDVELRNGRVAM